MQSIMMCFTAFAVCPRICILQYTVNALQTALNTVIDYSVNENKTKIMKNCYIL